MACHGVAQGILEREQKGPNDVYSELEGRRKNYRSLSCERIWWAKRPPDRVSPNEACAAYDTCKELSRFLTLLLFA